MNYSRKVSYSLGNTHGSVTENQKVLIIIGLSYSVIFEHHDRINNISTFIELRTVPTIVTAHTFCAT